ncbi:hypothetical protein CBL_04895 [Carabus blaptoides fortunei]
MSLVNDVKRWPAMHTDEYPANNAVLGVHNDSRGGRSTRHHVTLMLRVRVPTAVLSAWTTPSTSQARQPGCTADGTKCPCGITATHECHQSTYGNGQSVVLHCGNELVHLLLQ